MLEIKKYVRLPLNVDAVQVTKENMFEVAKWCEGTVQLSVEDEQTKFVGVKVLNPFSIKHTEAHVGDWVLKSDRGYKIYTERSFAQTFQPQKMK